MIQVGSFVRMIKERDQPLAQVIRIIPSGQHNHDRPTVAVLSLQRLDHRYGIPWSRYADHVEEVAPEQLPYLLLGQD